MKKNSVLSFVLLILALVGTVWYVQPLIEQDGQMALTEEQQRTSTEQARLSLEAAKAIGNDATQAEVDAAAEALNRAMADLRKFNASLEACDAIFDGRSDNLIELLDRLANDLGATTAILRERSEFYNNGWFDTRADDRFWFAYGQLYAQYGILSAAGADFEAVIRARGIEPLWTSTISQLRSALRIQPAIISNGREDGWIMPTHLATIGFYMLRVRSNFVEIRDVLAR